MDTMDLKGIAWVGNIYQKFEAMCLEVEEAMFQETANYVENQVQTMGVSMKRFYSDVMQDLLPPTSMDPLKVAVVDLSLNPYVDVAIHHKPKASIKEDTKKLVCLKGVSEDNSPPSEKSSSSNVVSKDWSAAAWIGEVSEMDEATRDQTAMISPQASVEVSGCNSREKEEAKICNCLSSADLSTDDTSNASPASGTIVLVESSAKKGNKLRYISSCGILSAEFIETCRDSPTQRGSYTSGDTQYGQSADEDVFISHTGDCNMDMIDTAQPRMETIGQDPNSKLEETLVLVDGDNFCSVAHKKGKNKSYKKKIRSAFSLKTKSARKQEYEQLATKYGETDKQLNLENGEDVMPTLATNSNSKLPTNDSESEWELL